MSLLTDLRTYLLTKTEITEIVSQKIGQEYIHERDPLPFIVYGRRGQTSVGGDCLDGSKGPYSYQIDLECRAKTLDVAEAMSGAVLDAVDGFTLGQWGDTLVRSCDVNTVGDDYEFLAEPGEFEHINAFSLTVVA